jgi:hypothetical protein
MRYEFHHFNGILPSLSNHSDPYTILPVVGKKDRYQQVETDVKIHVILFCSCINRLIFYESTQFESVSGNFYSIASVFRSDKDEKTHNAGYTGKNGPKLLLYN